MTSSLGSVAILLLSAITLAVAWEALNPEQVLFGFSRCGEDFTPNDENREIRIKNFAVWKLEPKDNWTMCYVRCCLQRLELFDLKTNKFMPKRLSIQHKAYEKYNGLTEQHVQEFANILKQLSKQDTCKAVFTTLFGELLKYVPTIVKLYHGNTTLNEPLYKDLGPNIRQKKQPYTVFCEIKFKSQHLKAICDFRRLGKTDDKSYKKVIDCIFKGFRYLDKSCKIDAKEIIRDFHAINETQLDRQVKQVISGCKVNRATKAYDYYECLRIDRRLKNKFRPAFLYREVRSADYDYAFQIPGPPVYDESNVKEEVGLITKEQCPNA